MRRPTEEPKREEVPGPGGPGAPTESKETHPAYGAISFSRIQGDPGALFGTHLDQHGGFIRMRVQPCQRFHHLSHDWNYPTGQNVVEVDMSYAQFAEMITTMNAGSGVPCTIRRVAGKVIPMISRFETEQRRVADGFKDKARGFAADIRRRFAPIDKMLDGDKPIGKRGKEDLRKHFDLVLQEITANIPFVLEQFQEAIEKTAVEAKGEVEGFILNALTSAGLEALHKKFSSGIGVNMLTDGDDAPDTPPE